MMKLFLTSLTLEMVSCFILGFSHCGVFINSVPLYLKRQLIVVFVFVFLRVSMKQQIYSTHLSSPLQSHHFIY